jgi:hypothetical protein
MEESVSHGCTQFMAARAGTGARSVSSGVLADG